MNNFFTIFGKGRKTFGVFTGKNSKHFPSRWQNFRSSFIIAVENLLVATQKNYLSFTDLWIKLLVTHFVGGMLQTSAFISRHPSEDEFCELIVTPGASSYAPGEEFQVTVDLKVKQKMINIRAIYWHLYGAEFLQREAGYLSRHVIIDKKEFLVGEPTALDLADQELPDVPDKTYIFEAEPFLWDIRDILPEKLSPTFRSACARIEYCLAVTVLRKGNCPIEQKLFIPIVTKFTEGSDLSAKAESTETGVVPLSGISRFWSSNASNRLTVTLDADVHQFCPYGMINPSVGVHLHLESQCNETISEVQSTFSRKMVLHHSDQDVTETSVLRVASQRLIPPLPPMSS
jgi:hypothetical protein